MKIVSNVGSMSFNPGVYVGLIFFLCLYGCGDESSEKQLNTQSAISLKSEMTMMELLSNVDKVCYFDYGKMVKDNDSKKSTEYTRRIELLQKATPLSVFETDQCGIPPISELVKLTQLSKIKPTLDDLGFVFFDLELKTSDPFKYNFGRCVFPEELATKGGGTGGGSLGGGGLIGAILLATAKNPNSPPKGYRVSLGFKDEVLPTTVQITTPYDEDIKELVNTIKTNGKEINPPFNQPKSFNNLYKYMDAYWNIHVNDYTVYMLPEEQLVKEDKLHLPLTNQSDELKNNFQEVLDARPWEKYGWSINDISYGTKIDKTGKTCTFYNHEAEDALSVTMIDYKELGLDKPKVEGIFQKLITQGDGSYVDKGYTKVSENDKNYNLAAYEIDKYNRGKISNSITHWNKKDHTACIVASLSKTKHDKDQQKKLIEIASAF